MVETGTATTEAVSMAWWVWPILLFITTFIIGIIAIPAGIGGGVLFVPIVGSFFPFNLDFVRGTSLIIALTSAIAASPRLLRANMANLRLALPAALIASVFSIIGAEVGLALPNRVVQIALGGTIIAISILLLVVKNREFPNVPKQDRLATLMRIGGIYTDGAGGEEIEWKVCRTPSGLLLFVIIGFMGGMFGLGSGWANVPVLNMVMGAPLKVAVGSSVFIISIAPTSAAWVYLNNGAVLPIIALPCILGMMLGAKIGARLLTTAKPRMIRHTVIVVLMFAGLRSLTKGLGIWP